MIYDVVIIGAGAAGLMCAAQAGYTGKRVLVLDHANKAGKNPDVRWWPLQLYQSRHYATAFLLFKSLLLYFGA